MSDTIILSVSELQAQYNSSKEVLIARINSDHNLEIDPNDYIFVPRSKGVLGKLWDKLFGEPEKDKIYMQLIAVKHECSENIDGDVSAS
jgi:hypothetical protein